MTIWLVLSGIILFLLLLVVISILFWSIKNGISPMPTSRRVRREIVKGLPNEINGIIYELGSGWGTLAFSLANRYPSQKIEAFETSPVPYLFCKIMQSLGYYPNLHFHRKNFFTISIKDAALIFCYLYPGAMQELKLKFENELPTNCLIISNTFRIPGWKPVNVLEFNDIYQTRVYLYKS